MSAFFLLFLGCYEAAAADADAVDSILRGELIWKNDVNYLGSLLGRGECPRSDFV